MAVDTPATIAVLGGGPIGLEAALYARYLGYEVHIYERGEPGQNLLQYGHVPLFTPFGMNRSRLGLAALLAQEPDWRPPADDALQTAREYVETYIQRLANSDLLIDNLHLHHQVLAIGKRDYLKGEAVADEARGDSPFLILVRDGDGRERVDLADVVIDATGVFSQPRWLGRGGIPAPGELAARDYIRYGLPDILGADRARYAGLRVLLIGSGYSAATNLLALETLTREAPPTTVTWAFRDAPGDDEPDWGPLPTIEDDPLPQRRRLAEEANRWAVRSSSITDACSASDSGPVRVLPGVSVDSIEVQGNELLVRIGAVHSGTAPDQDESRVRNLMELRVDAIVANCGYRPDRELYRELQIHECYASEGPMRLAAQLAGQASSDCLAASAGGPQALLNPEPNFYVLGAKSYGRDSRFLIARGLDQIRDLFSIIGERADLDLYAHIRFSLPE